MGTMRFTLPEYYPRAYMHAGYEDGVVDACRAAIAQHDRLGSTPEIVAERAELRARLARAISEAGDMEDLTARRERYLDGQDDSLDADEIAELNCGDD